MHASPWTRLSIDIRLPSFAVAALKQHFKAGFDYEHEHEYEI